MTRETTYNGWTNYDTWNVSLWINNEEPLYRDAVRFMRSYTGNSPYRAFVEIEFEDISTATPDGVAWLSDALDYDELDAMLQEMVEGDDQQDTTKDRSDAAILDEIGGQW